MDKFKEQFRRGTQKVLQTVGMAEKTVDDSFESVKADYKAVGALRKEIEKDVAAIITSMTTLSNSAASLAVHMQQSENLLRSGLLKPTQSPLDPPEDVETSANAAEIAALHEALDHFYSAQKLVTRKVVSAALQDLKSNAYTPLAMDDGSDPLAARVSQAMDRRNSAQLDYDSLRRKSQSQTQVSAAHEQFVIASQEAEDIIRGAILERSATIVNSFSVVLRSLTKFYADANTVMTPVSKDINPLSTVVNAYTHPHHQPASGGHSEIPVSKPVPKASSPIEPPAQVPNQQASTMFEIPPTTSPTTVKPVPKVSVTSGSVFDIMDGIPDEESNTNKGPSRSTSNNALLDVDFSASSQPVPQQSKSALDDFFGSPSVTPTGMPSAAAPSGGSAADAFGDFGAPLQPSNASTGPSAPSSSVDMLFGDAPLPTSSSSFSMFGDAPSQSSGSSTTPQLSADDSKEILPSKEDVQRWSQAGGRVNNLRALLSSMHTVLWPGSGWKQVSLSELVDVQQVKDVYKRAFLIVHPDKVVGPRRQDLARMIFAALRAAYDSFKKEIAKQQAASAPSVSQVNPHAGDVD